jgi:molybdenum cofactor cytidylyltransferase
MQVNIILLAAGKGQRFQTSSPNKIGCEAIKQLVKLNEKPLILHSIEHLQPLLKHVEMNTLYVSLGANKNAIQAVLPQDVSIIACQEWSQGMGHTLAESVQAIKSHSSHVLIALADQPLISKEHYQALLEASKKHPTKIIATQCDGQFMAPAIFPEKYFSQLIKLQGDKGAGKLLKHYAAQVHFIPCAAATFDVDTLANLEQISHMLKQSPLKETTPSH